MDSSWTRDWTCVPCTGKWILHHWTMKQVPILTYSLSFSALPSVLGGSPPGSSQHHQQVLFSFLLFIYLFFYFPILQRVHEWCLVEWLWGLLSTPHCAGGHPHPLSGRHRSCQVPSIHPSMPQILGTTLFCCPFRPRNGFSFLLFQRYCKATCWFH